MNILVCIFFHFFVLYAADESNLGPLQSVRPKNVQVSFYDWLDEVPHLKLLICTEDCLSHERYANIPMCKKVQLINSAKHVCKQEFEKIHFFYNTLRSLHVRPLSQEELYMHISQSKWTCQDNILATIKKAARYLKPGVMDDAIIELHKEAFIHGIREYTIDYQWNEVEAFTDLEKIVASLPMPSEKFQTRDFGICDTFFNLLCLRRDYLFCSTVRDDEIFFS